MKKFLTKIPPAPLAHPNGGGLQRVATNKVKEQEIRVAEEQHKLKLAQIEAKHKPKAAGTKTRG
jgi:hypothetical protein